MKNSKYSESVFIDSNGMIIFDDASDDDHKSEKTSQESVSILLSDKGLSQKELEAIDRMQKTI